MSEDKNSYNYEEELKELSLFDEKNDIKISIENISGYKNIIKININKSLINSDLIDKDKEINFILLIKYNHPFSAPLLFCLTKFSTPELSDGRDFLEEVLGKRWPPKKKNILKKIIISIPKFINNYLQKISEQNDLKFIGKYYLDNIYELNILKLFPYLYFGDILEIIVFGNDKKELDEKRIIMITEGFILIFVEKGIFESTKLKLVFWGPIKALSIIKQIKKKDIIELKWKTKKEKSSLMKIKTENNQNIIDILMDCLTKKKIEYKVSTESVGPKKGKLPKMDIVEVEQEISKLEIMVKLKGKDESNLENIKQLMNLYEKAVQYYSALNDYRYTIYMRKTKKLFSQMTDKELGVKKKGEKKKGKKGKKSKKIEEKKVEKDEDKKDIKNEDKKENIKKEEEKKEINKNEKINVKNEVIEEKKIKDNKEEKIKDKNEDKKEEEKKEKKEDKKEEKEDKKEEEKKEEKKNESNEGKKEKKEERKEIKKDEKIEEKNIEEKSKDKKDEKIEEKSNDKKEGKVDDIKKKNEKKQDKEKLISKSENKGDNKEKSEMMKKYKNSGFILDLEDD